MFITLKQLEEEKRKAVSEAQDRIWLCERIDKLEQRVREIEERLRVLEHGLSQCVNHRQSEHRSACG